MPALAGVGRERENPRSERSEPGALKVLLHEVGLRGEGAHFPEQRIRTGFPVECSVSHEMRSSASIRQNEKAS